MPSLMIKSPSSSSLVSRNGLSSTSSPSWFPSRAAVIISLFPTNLHGRQLRSSNRHLLAAASSSSKPERWKKHPKKSSSATASSSSFYMRPLPPPSISLLIKEGERLLDEARAAGTAVEYLNIIWLSRPQPELTYCGLTSLVNILSALNIDPCLIWKGPWRWYHEPMLLDEQTQERVKVQGISFEQLVHAVPKDKVKVQAFFASECSLSDFRQHVINVTSTNASFILVSYLRSVMNQTGAGHFSPIAAYNAASDLVLILDVASFKYPPHWAPTSLLWEAMTAVNKTTGKSRGFMVISNP